MGEDAFRLQSRQGASGGDGFHACVKVPLPHQETQPGHAGVHLDVDLQCAAALHGCGAVRLRLGQGGHRLGDAVLDQLGHHGRGRVAQDQNGRLNAGPAEFFRLVQAGHRQIVRPQLLQLAGHLNGPVAVGVRLHHTQILHVGPDLSAGLLIVVGQGVQVDLRPGPSQNRFLHVSVTFSVSLWKRREDPSRRSHSWFSIVS